jgi:hypothetical protein
MEPRDALRLERQAVQQPVPRDEWESEQARLPVAPPG